MGLGNGNHLGGESANMGALAEMAALEPRQLMSGTAEMVKAPASDSTKLALIDSSVTGNRKIEAALVGYRPVFFDGRRESTAAVLQRAVSAAHKAGSQIDSLAIFSHGHAGSFQLGTSVVTADGLSQSAPAWRALASALAPQAKIELFACDAAAGSAGQALLDGISNLTGAAAYGSDDLTGKGGDWTLERASNGHAASEADRVVSSDRLATFGESLLLPLVVDPATATPNPVTGNTTSLHALGTDAILGNDSALTYTWSAILAPIGSTVTFSANGTNASKNSVATFNKAGVYTLSVSISNGLLAAVSSTLVTVSQTVTSVTVTPANPSMQISETKLFSATVRDQFGDSILFPPTITWTANRGTISALGFFTAPPSPSSATVTATSGGVSGSTTVAISDSAPTVTIPASGPLIVVGATGNYAVVANDNGGEAALTYSWAATAKPTGAANPIFTNNGLNAGKNTTATFSKAGNYTLAVTITDANGLSTISSLGVTVSATITSVAVSPGTTSLSPNASQQFTATAKDQFNDPLASQPVFLWTAIGGLVNPLTGDYTAGPIAGQGTVTATTLLVSGSASVTVTNAGPSILLPAAAAPAIVTGTTTNLSVLGIDDGGESRLTYTWEATSAPLGATVTYSANGANASKNTTATFSRAGSYTFRATVTDAGGSSTTSSITVSVQQTLTSIAVESTVLRVAPLGVQLFSATAKDQFGNPLTLQPLMTWNTSAGTITAGLLLAPAVSGTVTVTATSGSVTGTATTEVGFAPTVATPATAAPAIVQALATGLSVLGTDGDTPEPNLTYTWSMTNGPLGGLAPVLSANGNNAAKNLTATFSKAGLYTMAATISDGFSSTVSTVDVLVQQTPSALEITGNGNTTGINGLLQLSSLGRDQFGEVLSSQPGVTWSTTGGNIDSNGLLHAGVAAGPITVTATAGGLSASRVVNVLNAAPTLATVANAAGALVHTALSVRGADDAGENLLTYTWQTTGMPAGAAAPVFSLNGTNAAKDTIATVSKAGTYTFLVTVSDGLLSITSPVTSVIAAIPSSISVSPGTTTVASGGTSQLVAAVSDQFGISLAGAPAITWSIDGPGTISPDGLFTASATAGLTGITARLGTVVGSAVITTTVDVIPPPVDPTNLVPTIASAATASPAVVTSLNTFLSALGEDDGGESLLTYTWSMLSGPAGAAPTFSASNGSNAGKGVAATFDKAGAYSFLVTIKDVLGQAVTSSVSINVLRTATNLKITPPTGTVAAGQTLALVGTALDQFGAPLTTSGSATWSLDPGSVGTIDAATGVYSAPSSITNTSAAVARFTSGGLTKTVAVPLAGSDNSGQESQPTVAQPATGPNTPVTGTTADLSVLGADANGEDRLRYTWTATGKPATAATPVLTVNGNNDAKNTTAQFFAPGRYTFSVEIADGSLVTTSAVTVDVAQTYVGVGIRPANAIVFPGSSISLSAVKLDQFGNAMGDASGATWSASAGVISVGGLLTLPDTAGVVTVTATADGKTGSANVTGSTDAPFGISNVSANTTSATTGHLSAMIKAPSGSNYTGSWTLLAAPDGAVAPTITANGVTGDADVVFAARGTYRFAFTLSDGSLRLQTAVSLDVIAVAQSVTVTSPVATVAAGGQSALSVVAYDQFNRQITEGITWSVDDGGLGGVSGSGVYMAPFIGGGVANIRASVAGGSASALVSTVGKNKKAVKDAPITATVTGADTLLLQLGTKTKQKYATGDNFDIQMKVGKQWLTVGHANKLSGSVTLTGLQRGKKVSYRAVLNKGTTPLKAKVSLNLLLK